MIAQSEELAQKPQPLRLDWSQPNGSVTCVAWKQNRRKAFLSHPPEDYRSSSDQPRQQWRGFA